MIQKIEDKTILRRVAVLLLLLGFFAQVVGAATRTSITLDEPLHITSGYACLLTGDYRLVEEHPPLLKMLQAVPLLFLKPALPDPRSVPGWESGNLITVSQHVVVPYRPIDRLVVAARVPTMLAGVLLAALVTRWATDAFGPHAGLLALTLCAFDPNILAHAGVAATDLGATLAIFATLYTFWRWIRQSDGPSWQRMNLAACVLGLALGVKSTTLMVFPIFGLFILFGRPKSRPLRPYLLQTLAAGGIAFIVLWGLYRFEVGPMPGANFNVPAPSHLLPLLKLQKHMRSGHAAFLMGRNYHHGTWAYFPIAFALKTPLLPLALLILTALGMSTRTLSFTSWRGELALLALPILYFSLSLTSGLNIGYRHLLPILPFLFVWISRSARAIFRAEPLVRRASALLLSAYAITTLILYPWHLAYFNALAGGPDGGYRYLVDSNLDWGQTWKALKEYVEAHNITEFGLSQYTINDPHAYGLDYTPLPPWPDAPPVLSRRFAPPPGIYAISSTQLQGVVVADSEMFDYFRNQTPVARIGHAMFVYEVSPYPPTDWLAQCTQPVVPLTNEAIVEGIGHGPLRHITFDCTQTWIFPPGNGWYSVAHAYEGWGWTVLTQAHLAYEQTQPGYLPPFALYEWFGRNAPTSDLTPGPVHTAPSAWPPAQAVEEGAAQMAPLNVGDALVFLGVVFEDEDVQAGASAGIRTKWRVTRTPAQPFSLMAHLLDTSGRPIAVGDGLGISIEQLQPNDVLVQRHVFNVPADTTAGTYWVQIGAYTQPDIQRLPICAPMDTDCDHDRMIVGSLDVKRP